jgi:hypothetical protein
VIQPSCERKKSGEQLGNLAHEKEGAERGDKDQYYHIGKCEKIVGEYAALWGHAESAKQINEIGWGEVQVYVFEVQ